MILRVSYILYVGAGADVRFSSDNLPDSVQCTVDTPDFDPYFISRAYVQFIFCHLLALLYPIWDERIIDVTYFSSEMSV